MSIRNNYLFVCTNRRPPAAPRGSCAGRGSEEVFQLLKREIQERGLSQVEVRACQSSCLDLCLEGPIVLWEPGHRVFTRVKPTDVTQIVDAVMGVADA